MGGKSGTQRRWRSFEEARAFARSLKLKSQAEWSAYRRSGERPDDIPTNPQKTYTAEWQSWGDWLGTDVVATRNRVFRPFREARAVVHTLGLTGHDKWLAYCRSGKKPDDVPATPDRAYTTEWQSWGDWLGTGVVQPGKRVFRPFAEARAIVHELGLKSQAEWDEYRRSGRRPEDIPSNPPQVYKDWRGFGDWLGVANRWTKLALVAFLEDLGPNLRYLEERELYEILRQGGQLPALQAVLNTASPMAVLRDLAGGGQELERAISQKGDSDEFEAILTEDVVPLANDLAELDARSWQDAPGADEAQGADADQYAVGLPQVASPDGLRAVDALADLHYGLDDEAAEFLVMNRVNGLWLRYFSEGRAVVDAALDGDGGQWFNEIKNRFLGEVDGVERLRIPRGWAYTVEGMRAQPNLMQRRAAWVVHERRRAGNWSGVGTGKTLSAVLASRVSRARATLVVTNNATVDQWAGEILNAYPDSVVYTAVIPNQELDQARSSYVVLNYEKFQVSRRNQLVHQLLDLDFDLVVFDEVQFVKQRDANASRRRQALEAFVSNATERNPELRVLSMSATPVINNLLEARKLLEITTGKDFADLGTQATINNALAVHRALLLHGFRQPARYDQEMRTIVQVETHNALLEPLRNAQHHVLTIEQVLLPAKLDMVKPYLRKGVLVYSHYVEGMLQKTQRYIEEMGLRVGLYTGTDKSGLDGFLKGRVDVLVASRPVGTGLDGLQKVCNRLVMLCLPWTNAEYEQIVGRIRRQGSAFGDVEIIVPQVTLDHEGETWSWDQRRMACIEYKRTLSDCALDGQIPETVRISPNALLKRGQEALERWIARVSEDGLLLFDRAQLKVPLPTEIQREVQRRHGDFGSLNRRWNTSKSRTTHERLQLDPSEWYLYHTLYRKARETWPEQPYGRIADRIRARPDWVVGDFGCGECLLADAVPNQVINLDHVACRDDVRVCDMAETALEAHSLDAAVFSLSLMGTNWTDYLREAHRAVKPFGHLFVVEPRHRWDQRVSDLSEAVEAAGFRLIGDVEQRYDFLYLTAVRESS